MKYFTKHSDLPILDLYNEYMRLVNCNTIQWNSTNQICINAIPGKTNDIYYGSGSLYYDWQKSTKNKKGEILNLPIREVPLEENQFTEVSDAFKGTLFEDILFRLQDKFNLGRVRLMKSKPKTCLSWHWDDSTRLHYPLKTHKGCIMVIENEVMHIPKHEWWATNTLKNHTAFNGSMEERIHLVAAILND
jgi:hypothetical protein